VTGHRRDLWTDSEVRLEDLKQPVVILAGELPANRWTADILRQVPPADSEEGFGIQTLSYPQRTFIVVRGADSSGVRYGLHHIVEALEVDRAGTIRFPRMKMTRVPLVKHRLLGLVRFVSFANAGEPSVKAIWNQRVEVT